MLVSQTVAFLSVVGFAQRAQAFPSYERSSSPYTHLENTGVHAYAPPIAGQTRGACPGLNVLANHGYFDRSGVTNFLQTMDVLTGVYQMGADLALGFAVTAITLFGDPVTLTYSIGDVTPDLLGAKGLDESHNAFESDASATRGDSYLTGGDVQHVQIANFKALYSLGIALDEPNFNSDIMRQHRINRLNASISTNPHFFFGPFSGLLVSTAAHSLVARFFANFSSEHPEGWVSPDTLKSFFGVTGDSIDDLVYTPGTERFPDNFYTSATPIYGATQAIEFVASFATVYPQAVAVGGNTGTVNSFVGVDLGDLTGGVFNAANLLQGNNLFCFTLEAVRAVTPSVLFGLVDLLDVALNFFDDKLGGLLSGLECPNVTQWNLDVFSQYPGATPW